MITLLRTIALIAAGYVALCVLLYLIQDTLIFHPRGVARPPEGPHVEAVAVERPDAVLRGWIVNPRSAGPVVIYFGGNAEELSSLVDVFAGVDATTVLVNYRGYGRSEGSPSGARLVADARAVVAAMHRRFTRERPRILFGRSIGAGIAVLAAQAAPVDGMVLLSPYRSLTHLVREHMPFVPVDCLLRHHIDATAALDALPPRLLVLYGRQDYIIPPAESAAFVDLLREPPRVVRFEAGHNVPLEHRDLWPRVRRFIETTAAGPPAGAPPSRPEPGQTGSRSSSRPDL